MAICCIITTRSRCLHCGDVIKSAMAYQITSRTIVYSIVYPGADQWKHQSSASLAFVRGIHWWLMNSPHKGPVTRKMFPFDDVIMIYVIIMPSNSLLFHGLYRANLTELLHTYCNEKGLYVHCWICFTKREVENPKAKWMYTTLPDDSLNSLPVMRYKEMALARLHGISFTRLTK